LPAAFIWDQIFLFGEHHIHRISIAVCHAIQAKVKWAADWLRVIRDCGLIILKIEDIQPSLEKVSKKFSLDYVKQL
jgi:hypothetical protein